jgi:hypothetical protein
LEELLLKVRLLQLLVGEQLPLEVSLLLDQVLLLEDGGVVGIPQRGELF